MAKRRGFPKSNASPRTIRRWKARAVVGGDPVKIAKVRAWEAANGDVPLE